MKIKKRDTAKLVMAKRITGPETRTDPQTGKKIALLSYINAGSFLCHNDTTKDLFIYAAGTNEEGEPVEGLDRLINHRFVVHLDKQDRAAGIDVIPDRVYRSGVVPNSQLGVTTLKIRYDVDGAVAIVTQRPPNTRGEVSQALIRELDKLIQADKEIVPNMRLSGLGRIVSVQENTVEIRPSKSKREVQGLPQDDVDSVDGFEEVKEETVPA